VSSIREPAISDVSPLLDLDKQVSYLNPVGETLKVYLDNSIIGRLVDIARGIEPPERRLEEDMAVLPGLIALCRKRKYRLCISVDAKAEIARVKKLDRREELSQQLQGFELLPAALDSQEAASLASSLNEFLLSKTRITKPKKEQALRWDAFHLASCRLSACDVFLTTDYASIWTHRHAIKRLCGINVRRPAEFYEELALPRPVHKMEKRQIIHVDLDAFFTSVEELLDPSLRGKPIIVGGDPTGRGVVASASYAARRYGVRSAMQARIAARRCPEGIFLPVRIEVYREYSKRVMSLLREYGDLLEPASVDEAFLDVTRMGASFDSAAETARAIQDRIGKGIGLPCSVGVARSKLVARIACRSGKPGGCTVVPPGQEESFLAPIPVDRLWGVGPRTKARLESMGVRTTGELACVLPERLVLEFGHRGLVMYQHSRGIDATPVTPRRPLKSVSREHTFERDLDDPQIVEDSLRSLTESLALRLHQLGMKGRTVTVKLRYSDYSTFTCSRSRALGLDTAGELYQAALDLLRGHWRPPRKLRLVGIKVSNLRTESNRA